MKFFTICLVASTQAINVHRGDAYPATILPGSEPIMPIPSAPIFLQQQMETTQESHIRHKLQHKLRKALRRENYPISEDTLVFLGDEGEDTVEGARIQAAQMQAQLDKAVADADEKREAQ